MRYPIRPLLAFLAMGIAAAEPPSKLNCGGSITQKLNSSITRTPTNIHAQSLRQRRAQGTTNATAEGENGVSGDPVTVRLAGIMDTTVYDWAADVFAVTIQLINEGWWDILPGGFRVLYDLEDAKCDATTAVRSYWKLRTENGNKPMHGIVGARCSGASVSLARIAGLEGVPQISPASQTATLSDAEEFPYFSRLMAPNNEKGESTALIAMLRKFGWERVTILSTDAEFPKNFVSEFQSSWLGPHIDDASGDSWTGEVAHTGTIGVTSNGTLDMDSVLQTLQNVPTDDPTINSRVVVLIAHSEHALHILEQAHATGFQPDTIWVGTSGWVANNNVKDYDDFTWLPRIPGYLGVGLLRNRDDIYNHFLGVLQQYQQDQGKEVLEELPLFAAEVVDSIRALTTAIMATEDQKNGDKVVQNLRELQFDGISGRVEFTKDGDRKNPLYSIYNAKTNQPRNDGGVAWTEIGTVETEIGSAQLTNGFESVCFAKFGCGLDTPPEDTYPIEPTKVPVWVPILIVLFALLFVAVAIKYWRSRRSKGNMKAELETFRKSVVGMRAAERKYIPRFVSKKDEGDVDRPTEDTDVSAESNKVEAENDVDVEHKRHSRGLSGSVTIHPDPVDATAIWIWRETSHCMNQHADDQVYGDRKNCWVKYAEGARTKLEEAYQKQKDMVSPMPGYMVDLRTMQQTKETTGFTRKVQRIAEKGATKKNDDGPKTIDLADIEVGDDLPADLKDEPCMVLVEGDVVQVSKQREDGWAFGTKLHHADEATARQLVTVALNGNNDDENLSVFTDTGWFQLDHTRVPTTEDITLLQENVGASAGALDPPDHWDEVIDASLVQQHELPSGNQERDAVEQAFMSTLCRPRFNKKVKVVKVERIQNLAMWQSYIVKRQTICYRETGHVASNDDNDDAILRNALDRYERRWLFHGTDSNVMDKILQQGFNRSFCGKNATAFGKGVYFARDASYSASPTYSVPDHQGHQYMIACRVVVGEYCIGKQNALTPDIRDYDTQSLYDTTVDNMSAPSIYVTYHDSQAYPEYLITFKTS